jgi:hypothetical protein
MNLMSSPLGERRLELDLAVNSQMNNLSVLNQPQEHPKSMDLMSSPLEERKLEVDSVVNFRTSSQLEPSLQGQEWAVEVLMRCQLAETSQEVVLVASSLMTNQSVPRSLEVALEVSSQASSLLMAQILQQQQPAQMKMTSL